MTIKVINNTIGATLIDPTTNSSTGYSTIQDAVNAAVDGDTIELSSGTDSENVIVNKSVTIEGANAGTDPTAARGAETVLTGQWTLSNPKPITIDGVEFLDNGVQTNNAGNNFVSLTVSQGSSGTGDLVENSIFNRTPSNASGGIKFKGSNSQDTHRAIEISNVATGTSVSISGNLFTGANPYPYAGDDWRTGVYSNGGDGTTTISGNTFQDVRSAINADNFSPQVNISGNNFESAGTAISVGAGSTTANISSITNNVFGRTDADLNVQNLTSPTSFNAEATGNVVSCGQSFGIAADPAGGTYVGGPGATDIENHTGASTFTFSPDSTLLTVDPASVGPITLGDLTNGQSLDLLNLPYAAGASAQVLMGVLTVTSGGQHESFTLTNPSFSNYSVVQDSTTGTEVDFFTSPAITGATAGQTTAAEAPITPFSGVTVTDGNVNATDTLTITLGGAGGTLTGAGLTQNPDGSYTLASDTAASVTAALDALSFTPTAGAPNTSSTTTFTLSDASSADSTPTTDATTSVIDSDPAVAPTITGTVANQATASEAAVKPFSGVTIGDNNGNSPTDSLTITLRGTGGTLTGAGLTQNPDGTYTLAAGTAANVTAALDALSFTPTAGAPNTSSATTFTLSDASSAGTTATNTATSVIESDPAVAPTITGTVANQATASEAAVKPFSGVTIGDPNGNSPTDSLTITLGGTGGTLTGAGLTRNPDGSYTLASGTAAGVTAALDALSFTPTAGAPNTSSTTSFTLSDKSSAFGTATTNTTTSVVDSDPAVAPTITGAVANQATASEAAVKPFSGVTIADGNGNAPTETLTITLGGSGGTLTGNGLTKNPDGTYTLTGSAGTVTANLHALSFTSTAGAPNTSSTTSFTLSDKSSAGTTATNATTSVVDSDPAVAPTITGTVANQATTSEGAVKPFSGVTIGDTNGNSPTDTVTITLGGTGGTLTGAGLTQNPDGSYTLASGTAAGVTAALDALSFTPTAGAPNTSSTTTFALSDVSSAKTTASDGTTSVIDSDPAAPSDGTGPGAPTNSTPTPPSVAFDPTVTFSDSNTATLTGTVSDASGVKNVEIFEGTSDLGSATVDPTTNTWAFTYRFAPGFHTGLAALATGNDNVTTSAPSSYDLTTGVKGEPYAAYQDNYDPASGAFEGQTFFTRHGALEMQTQYSPTQDGGYTVLSSGGTAFAKTPYFAVVDTYDAGGQPVEEDVYYKDGHQTVSGLKPGETLSSISNDTFYSKGGNNTFVFTPHFGADTITSFVLGGAHHDTISLPDSAASRLGSILAHATTDAAGDTTLHLNGKDSITIQGVSVAELKQHKNDFTFHA